LPLLIAAFATCAGAAEAPLGIHIHSDKAMFQVLISPGRAGADSFVLQLMNGDGTLLSAKAATLVLSRPGSSDAPIARKAALGADSYWHVENVPMPASGRWHVRVEAETPFHTIILEEDFDLPGQ
jgi:copper transport protein